MIEMKVIVQAKSKDSNLYITKKSSTIIVNLQFNGEIKTQK